MVAKFSASASSGDDGDGVEVLKNEPYEQDDQRGQYTHKIYHLAKLVNFVLLYIFLFRLRTGMVSCRCLFRSQRDFTASNVEVESRGHLELSVVLIDTNSQVCE